MTWGAVAVGGGVVLGGVLSGNAAKGAADTSAGASRYAADLQNQQYLQGRQDLAPYRQVAVGEEIYGNPDNPDEVTGYTGGALNTLADYGRSRVNPGDYIPPSDIPQYQRSVIDVDPNINAPVEGYNSLLDLNSDPSYQFRKAEQERAINRNMGAMGKIASGNRLDEIMKRSGEMASQEYAAAYGRNQKDYNLNADAEDRRYGRDTDQYTRQYNQDIDQYGRDLTAYNADKSRENALYGRGVDDYGRAYGAEGDWLNRESSLADIGQTAVNSGNALGANAASNAGNAIIAAGNAGAAGRLGTAGAYSTTINQLSQLAGDYLNQPQSYNYDGYGGTGSGGLDVGFNPSASGWDWGTA